ncbi:MAG: aminomethyl-transferring glycine dehydrogenase subunit GcvPA [Spirochaetota bacterium]
MHPYIPHTSEEVKSMLSDIGVNSIDDLFADIPEIIKLKRHLNIPDPMSEFEVYKELKSLSEKNKTAISFLGGGSYDHIIPVVVQHIISRSEFYTSYTPYQAEISQGTLQSIFEFQSLICELTGLDVSNASLYDGHTAASEASVMALNSVKKSDTILISEYLHPFTKQVLKTYFLGLDISIVEIKGKDGRTDIDDLKSKISDKVAGLIVQTPNFLGILEDLSEVSKIIRENKKVLIISSNPLSLSILKNSREWDADIAIGDLQPFGIPQYFGGPSAGYIAAKEEYLRKMPGRIVGQTVDKDGNRGFVLTLQAREQHIKRERATSNICSNQALMALASTVYMSVMGKSGLKDVAIRSVSAAHYLADELTKIKAGKILFNQPYFNEFAFIFNKDAKTVISELKNKGIFGGIMLESLLGEKYKNAVLIATTEKRTKEEIDLYVRTVGGIL